MALISEVEDKIYEIRPEGKSLDCFPLGTVYLVVDDKTALIEAGCPAQAPDILEALEKLGCDSKELSYVIPTHGHTDHAGGVGHLTRRLPQLQVVTHPRTAKLLADSEMLSRLMQGFKRVFGDDAQDRFGTMLPVPQEKFVLVEDGESIPLGGRELKVILTSGHEPYHLSFLDTKSRGLFCGDALGAYFPEIKVLMSPPAPGSDLPLILRSIEKLQELNPAILFFSHGSASREAAELIQLSANDARQCPDIALEALKAGESQEEVAHRLLEAFSKGSALAREELLSWPYLIPVTVEGYRHYFKKNKQV